MPQSVNILNILHPVFSALVLIFTVSLTELRNASGISEAILSVMMFPE